MGDQELAARVEATRYAVSLAAGQLNAMTRADIQRPIAAAPSDVAVSVRERSRHAIQSELSRSEVVLRALTDEQQYRLEHPGHAVPDAVGSAELGDLSELDTARTGSETQGRAWAAADEPVRVGSPDMASEEAAQDSASAPRQYATLSDRELAVRLSDAEHAVTVTDGQLDAMIRADVERQKPLAVTAAKMRERSRLVLQRQLGLSQTEVLELTEEQQLRIEQPELSVPDAGRHIPDHVDDRHARDLDVDAGADRQGPAM